jgi:hypothetical protein
MYAITGITGMRVTGAELSLTPLFHHQPRLNKQQRTRRRTSVRSKG